ncbi:MAG TPA: DUF3232 domain-containing protein [Candidatus Bipolaricaulota bacterium]|nr:DUF3232 domain-containing protein [Candidatus Bipolaricaulota bacterium]
MKEKPQNIDLSYWHNQKEGGFDPETGVLHEPGSEEYEKWLRFLEYVETSGKKETEETQNYDKLKNVIDEIDKVNLSEDEGDKEAEKQLKEQKKRAKELLDNALSLAIKYIEIVLSQEKKVKFIGQVDMKAIISSDERRSAAHNALISSLIIANRYIYQHFAKLPEAKLDEFIAQEEDANRDYIEVERIDLTENTFLPLSVNLKDRYSVSRWAYDLMRELDFRSEAKL